MPSRKTEPIVRALREEILSGQRAPGARLPTYDAFVEQFAVTRPTIARVFRALRGEGLVTVDGTRGLFVAHDFPHQNRYFWVTSERPGSPEWTSLAATILELVERGETGIPGVTIPLLGVDGRANNPEYQTLCDAVRHGSAAGLLLMSSATTVRLPVLQTPGLARVAISGALPHAAVLSLDFAALIERACARVLKRGRRVAVFSPHAPHLERARECLLRRGLDDKLLMTLHVGSVGCEKLTEFLFDRPDAPDALFVTDDGLVAPLLAGLQRAKMRPRRDVYVLAHCNWPRPIGAGAGVEHIGFDVRELLSAAKDCIDAQRGGQECPGRVVPPRFESEILTSARRALDSCIATTPGRLETTNVSVRSSPRLSSAA